MEAILAFTVAIFFAVSIYLMLSKHIIRILLGVSVFSNAVNLTIFTAGRVTREVPPIIPIDLDVPAGSVANPLPQALILTAIVISFSIFAFLLVLAFRSYQELGTDDTDGMRVAEPKGEDLPPLGY
ncbi:Na+/H+ antiporter subunit C [Chelativorans sp. M5D2P16]|uniref:Na+/H+ antiporter subunit C n=1 Tax=Chelativorans sp. M5D2P16 TaxID=3095678 RepID=UPI002AC9F6F6|nr:Na+/H+ antiporter subunit C [Chelativorans sp. M5D2P16]MDZ5698375.1 Na+/H+ antiporter subunit C [Chelativorans sp. M5D2P16]